MYLGGGGEVEGGSGSGGREYNAVHIDILAANGEIIVE